MQKKLAIFISALAFFMLLVITIALLPLREPPTVLSLGEYIVGDYPTGIAIYQPSSGHYYATSIYDDYIVQQGITTPLSSLTNSQTSRDTGHWMDVLLFLATSLQPSVVRHTFDSSELRVQTTVQQTASNSAVLTRTWRLHERNIITQGFISIKYHPLDVIVDPLANIIYGDETRQQDMNIFQGQTKQSFTASGPIPDTTSVWGVSGNKILLTQPDGAGLLELKATPDQQIVIDPTSSTINFVTNLQQQTVKDQKIQISFWPTHLDYPWSNTP